MNNLAMISIDGTIFYGFSSAARALACDRKYLSYKAHKFKGNFTFCGRKVKVLNFMKIANYNSFEKRKNYINERLRNYYHEKKKRQLSTKSELVG